MYISSFSYLQLLIQMTIWQFRQSSKHICAIVLSRVVVGTDRKPQFADGNLDNVFQQGYN